MHEYSPSRPHLLKLSVNTVIGDRTKDLIPSPWGYYATVSYNICLAVLVFCLVGFFKILFVYLFDSEPPSIVQTDFELIILLL